MTGMQVSHAPSADRLRGVLGVLALSVVLASSAVAQSAAPGQRQPTPGDPTTTIPEKIEPAPGPAPGPGTVSPPRDRETLSEKLQRNDGVIRPPQGVDPDIRAPAPVPNPNTTPVIPPPGSPGNPSPVRPK